MYNYVCFTFVHFTRLINISSSNKSSKEYRGGLMHRYSLDHDAFHRIHITMQF